MKHFLAMGPLLLAMPANAHHSQDAALHLLDHSAALSVVFVMSLGVLALGVHRRVRASQS